MDTLSWRIITSPQDAFPLIVSEYLLNDLGIFVKSERRIPKNRPLTAVTGFRVGYTAVPDTDYRAAPVDRNALLWHKITSVEEISEHALTVSGNRSNKIEVFYPAEMRDAVIKCIILMRQLHHIVTDADPVAAAFLCWRDDDDWGDPFLPLIHMVEKELHNNRFIELEILNETALTPDSSNTADTASALVDNRPKFCANCGAALITGGKFCVKCGCQMLL